MIADMLSNKKLNTIVTGLCIRSRKLDIPLVFITQFDFAVVENIKLNSTHYFIVKIRNKQKILQTALFLVIDTTFVWWWWWWWWWWIVFGVWLTDKRCLALFPAGTIVRDPHHRESPTRSEQGLNLRRSWVQA